MLYKSGFAVQPHVRGSCFAVAHMQHAQYTTCACAHDMRIQQSDPDRCRVCVSCWLRRTWTLIQQWDGDWVGGVGWVLSSGGVGEMMAPRFNKQDTTPHVIWPPLTYKSEGGGHFGVAPPMPWLGASCDIPVILHVVSDWDVSIANCVTNGLSILVSTSANLATIKITIQTFDWHCVTIINIQVIQWRREILSRVWSPFDRQLSIKTARWFCLSIFLFRSTVETQKVDTN